MKELYKYVLEAETDDEENTLKDETSEDGEDSSTEDSEEDEKDEQLKRRANIKFTIWEEPQKRVNWVKDNNKYQKIEYKFEDKEKQVFIHFLLGFKNNSWNLWIGKIGAVGYDDDPEYDLETKDFKEAILTSLDKIEDYIDDVYDNPDNWVQYYKNK